MPSAYCFPEADIVYYTPILDELQGFPESFRDHLWESPEEGEWAYEEALEKAAA